MKFRDYLSFDYSKCCGVYKMYCLCYRIVNHTGKHKFERVCELDENCILKTGHDESHVYAHGHWLQENQTYIYRYDMQNLYNPPQD